MKTVIVLPTYNEQENIQEIIPRLENVFQNIPKHEFHILVADDNSPDKTAESVQKFMKEYNNIHLLLGQKQGLGAAYWKGFAHAIEKLNAELLFEMDADLSHPPEMIPQFMEEINKGYDIVIGSRYIKGGATPDWPLQRWIISKGGNTVARVIAGLHNIHDCTSGFRAVRASTFQRVHPENIKTKGYGFQITLLYELLRKGAKIKEIPLIFYDRKFGRSKVTQKDIIEFFCNACRLRWKSLIEQMSFVFDKIPKRINPGGNG